MLEIALAITAIAVTVIFLSVNRRFVRALREPHRYRLPSERFIERGEVPLPSPSEFANMARLALFRHRDPVVERLRVWNWVVIVLWLVVLSAFMLALLSPRF